MHFHPGWSGPVRGFDHEGCHLGGNCYKGFDQQ
jgi:hypothetical protein